MKRYGLLFNLTFDLVRACSQSAVKITIALDERSPLPVLERFPHHADLKFPSLRDLCLSGPYKEDILAISKGLVRAPQLRSLSIDGSVAPSWDGEIAFVRDILTHLVGRGQPQVTAIDLPHSALSDAEVRTALSALQSMVHFDFSRSDCRYSFQFGDAGFYYGCFYTFPKLTKLSLELCAWRDIVVQEFQDIFNKLPRLKMLQLWCDGFLNDDDQNPVPLDHDRLRDCLNPLTELTHLAISGDCIVAKHGHWYPSLHRQTERSHLSRTLSEACKYKSALPTLQWMYLGQYPLVLSGAHAPRTLTSERVSAHGHLSDMFHVDGWMAGLHEHSVDWNDWYVMGHVDEGLDDHDSEDTDEEERESIGSEVIGESDVSEEIEENEETEESRDSDGADED